MFNAGILLPGYSNRLLSGPLGLQLNSPPPVVVASSGNLTILGDLSIKQAPNDESLNESAAQETACSRRPSRIGWRIAAPLAIAQSTRMEGTRAWLPRTDTDSPVQPHLLQC